VNLDRSVHPAYHFYLSTRDMARFGYLILRGGGWNGQQIVPADWVKTMTSVVTPVDEMNPENYRRGPFGYGYLWWIWDGPANTGIYRGGFTGVGAIGQYITVLPELDMVIAHKTRPQRGNPSVGRGDYLALIERIAGARCGQR
jgi:CubicO group peptidase (beta-lactamase class C family)